MTIPKVYGRSWVRNRGRQIRLWMTQCRLPRWLGSPIPEHTLLAENEPVISSVPRHFTNLPEVIKVDIGNGKE